jgi:hypothetical protein
MLANNKSVLKVPIKMYIPVKIIYINVITSIGSRRGKYFLKNIAIKFITQTNQYLPIMFGDYP